MGLGLPAIKRCPFCGHGPHLVYDYFTYISCVSCGAYGPEGDSPQDSINRWNNGENYKELKIKSTKYEQKN